ncbi:MAG: zinc transporter ZupT [Candidatus Goldbacteria bacterium]|nr:zinc transporter ZupT [Candidatus Goldiibacteriota bacterium]
MTINLLHGFFLTLFAGLATAFGSIIAFFFGSRGNKFLSFGMGLSAGVMVYISLTEIIPHSNKLSGEIFTFIAFLLGIAIAAIIDRVIPYEQNPHEVRKKEDIKNLKFNLHSHKNKKLLRTGLFTAFAISLHNFPEGFATFAAASTDLKLGVTLAIAVAIHNIPEGISVSVPIYKATGNKKKAFIYSALSGLAEPAGAFLGFMILYPFLNEKLLGIIMAVVAGIMIYISFDELLPTAREYGEGHIEVLGVISGMALMAISLIFM